MLRQSLDNPPMERNDFANLWCYFAQNIHPNLKNERI